MFTFHYSKFCKYAKKMGLTFARCIANEKWWHKNENKCVFRFNSCLYENKTVSGTMLKMSKEKNTSIIVSYIMLWPVFHFFVFCTFKSVWECLDYGDASHLSKKEKKSKKLLRISCIIAIKPCEQYQIIGRPALVFLRKI